jgi:CRP/FNR family transcriptional regulator
LNLISSSTQQKTEILRGNRYFAGFSDELLDDLAPDVELYRYFAGETIFFEGEECRGLYIVHRGRVKLYKLSPEGRELTVNVMVEGDSFNEVPVFDHGLTPINVEAIEDTQVWIVRARAIRAMMRVHPEVSQVIIQNLAANLRMLVDIAAELTFYQITTRLARLVLSLSEAELAGDSSERLTRDDLAARLGSVREVVARSLKVLEEDGAVEIRSRRIHRVDRDKLLEWAQLPEG